MDSYHVLFTLLEVPNEQLHQCLQNGIMASQFTPTEVRLALQEVLESNQRVLESFSRSNQLKLALKVNDLLIDILQSQSPNCSFIDPNTLTRFFGNHEVQLAQGQLSSKDLSGQILRLSRIKKTKLANQVAARKRILEQNLRSSSTTDVFTEKEIALKAAVRDFVNQRQQVQRERLAATQTTQRSSSSRRFTRAFSLKRRSSSA